MKCCRPSLAIDIRLYDMSRRYRLPNIYFIAVDTSDRKRNVKKRYANT